MLENLGAGTAKLLSGLGKSSASYEETLLNAPGCIARIQRDAEAAIQDVSFVVVSVGCWVSFLACESK